MLDRGAAQYTARLLRHGEHVALATRFAARVLLTSVPSRHTDTLLDRAAGLLALARERMRTRHLALRTEQSVSPMAAALCRLPRGRRPEELGAPDLEQFLTHLAVHRKVSSATHNQALQALQALLFLYRHVLEIELPWLDGVTRAAPARKLPVVPEPNRRARPLAQLQGTP